MKYFFNELKPLQTWRAFLLGAGGLVLLSILPFMQSILLSRIQNTQSSATNKLNSPTMSVFIDRPIGRPDKNLFITRENYPCMFPATHSMDGNQNGGESVIEPLNSLPSVARNAENLGDFSVNLSGAVKPLNTKNTPASTTSTNAKLVSTKSSDTKIDLLKDKINSFIWLDRPSNKKWLIGVGGEFVVTDKIVPSNSVVLSKNTVKSLAARAHDFVEQQQLFNGLARVKTSLGVAQSLKQAFEDIMNSQLSSVLSTSGIQELKLAEFQQANAPNVSIFSAIKNNQEKILLDGNEFTLLCHLGGKGELADTFLGTARAVQQIITIPSVEVVDFKDLEKFRKHISILEKKLINQGFSNDAVVTVSKPDSPAKLGFEWKPDLSFKLYSPQTRLFGLKIAGSFNPLSQEVSIGLGAAEITFGSGNVGLLVGVDTGVRFNLNNNSHSHFCYSGLALKGFVGVGFSTSR